MTRTPGGTGAATQDLGDVGPAALFEADVQARTVAPAATPVGSVPPGQLDPEDSATVSERPPSPTPGSRGEAAKPSISRARDAAPARAAWPGWFDLYRAGSFKSQQDPTWCTAAASQMMIALASGRLNRSAGEQAAFHAYGRRQRAYAFREPGLDPAAWVAILARFGGLRYDVVTTATAAEALRIAARQMRLTGHPAGLVVGRHGDHSWVMTGFTATADPAVTDAYTVTGIWALGPNWPRQRYYRGAFDSPPHTLFTAANMGWIMDRYADKLGPTAWDGQFVAVVPAG